MYLTLQMMREQFKDNPNVRFREEVVGGRSLTIVCYMISDDNLWKTPLGIECRGITFDTVTGLLVILPFEKFFNVNEKEHTQAHLVADYMRTCVGQVAMKMDGSMIAPVVINDKIYLKTKKSFDSDVAKNAQANMTKEVERCSKYFVQEGYTPIFEFYSPESKVVINYGDKPKFTLIAVRSMEDGSYLDSAALQYWADYFGLETPWMFCCTDLYQLIEEGTTAVDTEGWVIYLPQGRFKLKTKWYMDRHRLIDIRERDIARFALDETLDDMIPQLIEGGADMKRVREIESEVVGDLTHMHHTAESYAHDASLVPEGRERADYVKLYTGELQGIVFRLARGQEVSDSSYKDLYLRNHLSKWALRSIGNPNFRNDDEG